MSPNSLWFYTERSLRWASIGNPYMLICKWPLVCSSLPADFKLGINLHLKRKLCELHVPLNTGQSWFNLVFCTPHNKFTSAYLKEVPVIPKSPENGTWVVTDHGIALCLSAAGPTLFPHLLATPCTPSLPPLAAGMWSSLLDLFLSSLGCPACPHSLTCITGSNLLFALLNPLLERKGRVGLLHLFTWNVCPQIGSNTPEVILNLVQRGRYVVGLQSESTKQEAFCLFLLMILTAQRREADSISPWYTSMTSTCTPLFFRESVGVHTCQETTTP